MAAATQPRQVRIRWLVKMLNYIRYSKMHLGASETERFQMPYDDIYNSPDKCAENGYRSQEDIAALAQRELSLAQHSFRQACLNCEHRPSCRYTDDDQQSGKAYKENFFYEILNNKDIRRRFKNRIRREKLKSGIFTATCYALISPQRLIEGPHYYAG